MASEPTDAALLTQAVSGDQAALEELLLAHCPALSRHIDKRIPTPLQSVISVEDVLQETLLQAFRNIGRFKPKTSRSFSVWLKTIATNQLHNAVTSLTRQKRGGVHRKVDCRPAERSASLIGLVELLSAGRGTPSQSAMRHEAVEVVQVAIAGLPTDQRRAIELRFIQGKGLEECAVIMEKTTSSVRSLIHRAKQALKDRLGRSSRWFSAS